MSQVAAIAAMEILDSRGNPTVRVQLALDNGIAVSYEFSPLHRRSANAER